MRFWRLLYSNSHVCLHHSMAWSAGDCGQSKGLPHAMMKKEKVRTVMFYHLLRVQLLQLARVMHVRRALQKRKLLMLQTQPLLKLWTMMGMKMQMPLFVGSCWVSIRLCKAWLQLWFVRRAMRSSTTFQSTSSWTISRQKLPTKSACQNFWRRKTSL